jgi:hypothetical protein
LYNENISNLSEVLGLLSQTAYSNVWETAIQNYQWQDSVTLPYFTTEFVAYYNIFENFFNSKKEKILSNSVYYTEENYQRLIDFNNYTNSLFKDLHYKNYTYMYGYLESFRNLILSLKSL